MVAAGTVVFIVCVHAFVGSSLNCVDYLNSFYVAGLLVRLGRAADLYPAAHDAGFVGTAFDRFAHSLVPNVPADAGCNFLYPPSLALVFAPLSYLPARDSLLVWQITSLIALAAAAALFSRTPRANSTTSKVFFVSFLALTQVHILFLGQIGITFGVLPLAAGYLLWQKERHFLCGIMWSVLAIKLQTFLPVCLVAVAQLVAALAFKNRSGGRSRLQAATLMAAGLAAGVVLFQGSAILLFGLSSLDGWLQALSLVMKTLADPSQGWALQLIASLPGLITVASPGEWRQQMVAIAWLVSLSSLVLVFAALVKIAGAASDDDSRAKDLLLVVAYLSLPLVAHYLRIYDYSICLVPAWIGIFRGQRQSAVDQALFRAPVMLFFALDVYLIVLSVFGKDAASVLQLPLVITLIECWRQVTWPAYLLAARSPEPQSQAPLQ